MGSRRLPALSANIKPSCLLGAVLQVALLILPQQTVLAQVEAKEYGATRVDFAISGGSGFVIKPNRSEPAGLKPWVWYAPTFVKARPEMGGTPMSPSLGCLLDCLKRASGLPVSTWESRAGIREDGKRTLIFINMLERITRCQRGPAF
jgi:hypothetical protein